MTTPTQADREAAAHIDALEWLFCDGRVNPRLLAIIAAHRHAALDAAAAAIRKNWEVTDRLIDDTDEGKIYAVGKEQGMEDAVAAILAMKEETK